MGLYKVKGSKKWWMSFTVGGQQVRESTGTTVKRLAEDILRKRQTEVVEGRYFPSRARSAFPMAVESSPYGDACRRQGLGPHPRPPAHHRLGR